MWFCLPRLRMHRSYMWEWYWHRHSYLLSRLGVTINLYKYNSLFQCLHNYFASLCLTDLTLYKKYCHELHAKGYSMQLLNVWRRPLASDCYFPWVNTTSDLMRKVCENKSSLCLCVSERNTTLTLWSHQRARLSQGAWDNRIWGYNIFMCRSPENMTGKSEFLKSIRDLSSRQLHCILQL